MSRGKGNPQARKGAKGEREAAAILSASTGRKWDRRLWEGRADDCGDIICLDDDLFCVQVKAWNSAVDAFSAVRRDLSGQAKRLARRTGQDITAFGMIKVPRTSGWVMCWRFYASDSPIVDSEMVPTEVPATKWAPEIFRYVEASFGAPLIFTKDQWAVARADIFDPAVHLNTPRYRHDRQRKVAVSNAAPDPFV